MKPFVALLAILILSSLPLAAQTQTDVKGCKEHPLFTRMPTYWIHNCDDRAFDAYAFPVAQGKKESIEGHLIKVSYYPQATAKDKPSALQILRNHENSLAAIGGTVVWKSDGQLTAKVMRDGKEIWINVSAEFTGKYSVISVERQAMGQDVIANADALARGLKETGHVAVNGILFDTGKTDLKPESGAAIAEVVKLLKADPTLLLFVVGHTDNVGGLESNMRLSQGRADAVVKALVGGHGIAASRLKAFGNGPYAPVSTNETDAGRAKNRRVELVKQ
jgi:outer membrane protein OmpA-like peptidoglycan-associated protein